MNFLNTIAVAAASAESAAEAAAKEPGFDLFLDTLPIMGAGMLGIFAVTAVIIGAIYLLGLIKERS